MTTETAGAILGAIDTLRSLECNEDAADLQIAYEQLKSEGTVALPVADYGTRPVVPHPLDTLAAVAQFMHVAGQEVKATPGQPTPEVLKLRLSICLEELAELAEAFGLKTTFASMMYDRAIDWVAGDVNDTLIYDAVEVLDALTDLRYVQDGTVLACGLQKAFPEAFANVQASNMSKFCTEVEQAQATVAYYKAKGIDAQWATVEDIDANFPLTVYRTSDGKILKSIAYIPANLGPILKKHGGH